MHLNWLLQLFMIVALLLEVKSFKKPLYLLSLLPYPDPNGTQPSWTEGPTLILAEQLAVDIINKRTDILSDYTLQLLYGDSGCNIKTKAAVSFINQTLYSTVNVAGIVGPGCSTSTITVSPLSGREQTALIVVHGAGSLSLEDRTLYPYSFGTLDSTKAFAQAAHRLLLDNKWNRVGALYDPARLYYSTTFQYFNGLIECEEFFECSTNFFFSVQNTSIPLNTLQESQLRIIFLFVGPTFLKKILCLAFHQNMRPPTYQWIIVSRVVSEITSTNFNLNGIQYYCSDEDMKLMVNNLLILHYSLKPLDSHEVTDQGISYHDFLSVYKSMVSDYNNNISRILQEKIEVSFWATAYFDATWALALALNNSQEELKLRFRDLSEYKFGQPYATDIIKKNLFKLNFTGVSGQIMFRKSTGYVARLIDVYQVSNDSEMEIVAYYDSQSDTLTKIIADFEFVNGTFNQELITVTINLGIGVVFILLSMFQLVLIITLHICTLTFRNKKPVKASSPKLSHFAFFGCYILIVGATSYIIAETFSGEIDSNIKCNLIYVTYFMSSIGGTFIFASVCAHVWRLYRIYFFYLNPGKLLSDSALIAFIFVLIVCSLFLGALWVGFDRLVPATVRREVITEPEQDSGHDVFNLQVFLEIECLQSSSIEWLVSQLAFNLLVMGIALCLAILTRHIPHKDFKTRRIILLVYILSAVLVCGYVTSYILQISRAAVLARFIVLTTVHNCVIFFTALLLLLPPVFSAIRESKITNNNNYTYT